MNPAVSTHLLSEILLWNQEGARIEDVAARLRMRTVPSGYKSHNWIDGIYNFSTVTVVMLSKYFRER